MKGPEQYIGGSDSKQGTTIVVRKFHEEVIRQILLGNKVKLPGGATIEIVKHSTEKISERIGEEHKVLFKHPKIKKKKAVFITAISLTRKLNLVLRNTNFDYKAVRYGYK